MSSMYDGIDQVTSSGGGAYVQPGKHRFRINALKDPPDLESGRNFIAELTVVSSNYAEYYEGQTISWISNVTKGKKMALSEIKGFVAAAGNSDEKSVTAAACEAATSPDQPFAGALIDCEAWHKPLKHSDGVFTKTKWTAVVE